MPTVRAATPEDIPALVAILMQDAEARHAVDPILWRMAGDAPAQVEAALRAALGDGLQPVRQFWRLSEADGRVTGVVHAMLLPVPPIYAGRHGEPGLILADSAVVPGAPVGTVDALVAGAEQALRAAGARILLATHVTGAAWQEGLQARGYAPLTLYLSRSDPGDAEASPGIRAAGAQDVAGIVALAAENKRILSEIDLFWERHPEADARFAAWMTRSLTLTDRDMLVMGPEGALSGYAIAQPASRLHFPPAHDIAGTGVIDDYYYRELADVARLDRDGDGATALLRAAEAAFAARGVGAFFVVCPAGWRSKIAMLEAAGYETAMVWSIRR